MSDYLDILDNTPDGIDEDELQQMQAAQEQRQADIQTLQQEQEEETSSSPAGESKTPTSKEEQTTGSVLNAGKSPTNSEPKKEPEPTESDGPISKGMVQGAMAVKDAVDLPGKAMADFAIDAVNLIPGVNIPKHPKFHNETLQATREVMSVVVPTIFLAKTGVGAGAAAAKASKIKALSSPLMKKLGEIGASTGIGSCC